MRRTQQLQLANCPCNKEDQGVKSHHSSGTRLDACCATTPGRHPDRSPSGIKSYRSTSEPGFASKQHARGEAVLARLILLAQMQNGRSLSRNGRAVQHPLYLYIANHRKSLRRSGAQDDKISTTVARPGSNSMPPWKNSLACKQIWWSRCHSFQNFIML